MESTHTEKVKEGESEKMLQGERNTSIVMIKEKMKEKRRKKALNDSNTSWSRSRSKKKGGTNASFLLKASLHSNNQALAKALSTSKHEVHQTNQIILDYQRERQDLIHQANMRRQSEKECLNRFNNIKVVLTKVTTSLGDAVTSLGQALDLCSSLPIRESSLGICRSSFTSDDDSFNILPKTENRSSLCRKANIMSKMIESTSSDLMQAVDSMAVATNHLKTQSNEVNQTSHLDLEFTMAEHEDLPLMFTDEPWLKDGDARQSPLKEPPMKRSRTATLLDPVAIQKALTEPTIHDKGSINHVNPPNLPKTVAPNPPNLPKTVAPSPNPSNLPKTVAPSQNPPNLPKTVAPSPANQKKVSSNKQSVGKSRRATFNITPVKYQQTMPEETDPLPDVNEQFQPIVPNKDRYVFVHSPCEVTTYTALDMELTGASNSAVSSPQDDQSKTQDNKSVINHDDRVIRPWGNIQSDDPSSINTTSAKSSNMKTKASSPKTKLPKEKKGSRNKSGVLQSSKQMKKDTKKAFPKSKKKTSWMSDSFKTDLAVFDLSAGDSFSLPPSQLKQMTSKHCDTIIASNVDHDDSHCVKQPLSSEMLLLKDSDSNKAKIFLGKAACTKPIDDKEPTEVPSITPTSPVHHVHSEIKEKASKIQRKSKKARSVVTPGIDRAAQAHGRAKLTIITSPVEDEELDVFDGTYQYDQSHTDRTGNDAAASKKQSQSIPDHGKTKKPKNHLSIKEKPKTKAENNKKTIRKDSVQTMSNKESSSKIPLPSLTNDQSKLLKSTIVSCDVGHDPSDIQDDLVTIQKGQSVRVKGGLRKSSYETACNGALQQPSVTLCHDDQRITNQSTKGLKRKADEENEMEINDEETGRRSRRGNPVCYKEPSLIRKMRRQSPDKAKKRVTKKGQGIKRTALGTVTNVM